MKNTTLKFLEFPCSSDCVVSRGEDGFKLDFSKKTNLDSSYSKPQSTAKSKGLIGMLMLVILFLFSNTSSAQITLDGDPNDWGAWLAAPGGIKARIIDKMDQVGCGRSSPAGSGSGSLFRRRIGEALPRLLCLHLWIRGGDRAQRFGLSVCRGGRLFAGKRCRARGDVAHGDSPQPSENCPT